MKVPSAFPLRRPSGTASSSEYSLVLRSTGLRDTFSSFILLSSDVSHRLLLPPSLSPSRRPLPISLPSERLYSTLNTDVKELIEIEIAQGDEIAPVQQLPFKLLVASFELDEDEMEDEDEAGEDEAMVFREFEAEKNALVFRVPQSIRDRLSERSKICPSESSSLVSSASPSLSMLIPPASTFSSPQTLNSSSLLLETKLAICLAFKPSVLDLLPFETPSSLLPPPSTNTFLLSPPPPSPACFLSHLHRPSPPPNPPSLLQLLEADLQPRRTTSPSRSRSGSRLTRLSTPEQTRYFTLPRRLCTEGGRW